MNHDLHPDTIALLERIDQRLADLKMSDLAATQAAGINRDAIRNLRRGRQRGLGLDLMAKLADALGVTVGQLSGVDPMPERVAPISEHKRFRKTPQKNASQPFQPQPISKKRVPILGLAVGGADGRFIMNGELIDTTFCPPGLEDVPGVYAVFVSGSSMEPRFEPGEIVWVHPRRPPRRGNYVVVQIDCGEGEPPEGFIKKFVAWTPTELVLEQFNPPEEIKFPLMDVISVHVIAFHGMG